MRTAIVNERQSRDAEEWCSYTFVIGVKEVQLRLTNELMVFLELEEYDRIEVIDNDDGTLTVRKEN
jgi:alpha-N-acetylglucosamine transferase